VPIVKTRKVFVGLSLILILVRQNHPGGFHWEDELLQNTSTPNMYTPVPEEEDEGEHGHARDPGMKLATTAMRCCCGSVVCTLCCLGVVLLLILMFA
jgi:hypothetical protein